MSLKSMAVAGIVGGVVLGGIVGAAVSRVPGGQSRSVAVPIAPQPQTIATDDSGSMLAQSMSASTAQAAGQPNPGDDPRLDAWRIWLRSPNKGLQGPYTFWDIMAMKQSFGPTFGMPGLATDERRESGDPSRVVWNTLDSSIP